MHQKPVINYLSDFFIAALMISVIFPGPFSISGQVVDEFTSSPVESANIIVEGLDVGAATDRFGGFTVDVKGSGEYTLLISHIKYEDKTIPVKVPGKSQLTVRLKERYFEMDDVVITGTRTPKVLQNSPVATEVITPQDIQGSGARDIGELLSLRSGVSVSSSVAGGSIIDLLGMDSKYILILVDGQPLVGKFNSRASLDQIPVSSVNKVEIIKGPNSSLYGSEAMGGVINIITKSAKQGFDFSSALRYSSGDGYFKPQDIASGNRSVIFHLSQKRKKIQWSFDGDGDLINIDQTNQYIELDDVEKLSVTAGLKYLPDGKHSFSSVFSSFADNEFSHSSTESTETRIRRNAIDLTHQWSINSKWNFKQFFRSGDYSRGFQEFYPWGDIKQHNKTGEKESEYEISVVRMTASSTLNIGSEFTLSSYESDRISSGRQELFAKSLYSQFDYTPFDRVNMVYGLRYDDNSEIDPVFSPRVALMYSISTQWKFRAMWGKGFRMPSFMDRYIDWNHYQFGYHVVGNPDLKPESSTGYSAGAEYYHSRVYRLSIMIYKTYFRNMIDDYIVASSGNLSYRNIARVEFTSLELQGSWTISPKWTAGWGVNYVHNIDKTTNSDLPNTKPFSGNVKIHHNHRGNIFSYTFLLKWIGPYRPMEYIPLENVYVQSDSKRHSQFYIDYTFTCNLPGSFDFDGGIKNLNNITDEKYGPFIGRTYFIQLNYKINGEKK